MNAARRRTGRRGGAWVFVCAFALYLAVALAAWWHLLAHGFGEAIPAGSADPGQEVWFLAWLPHALGTGENPFLSRSIFSPPGVNLLDNTSVDLVGLLLAPVTVTAGPVAALDVAVLLAPALSALGAFALCRRHVSWPVAAFAGGLCYGFGPFVAGDLRYGHLDLTWLVLPPLILCCLDALVLGPSRRPVLVGATLGVLVAAQFFISTEMLAITALMVLAVAVVVSVGWPRAVVPKLASAWPGLAAAAVVAAGALAYPFWYAVMGPRHVTGPVWRHIGSVATSLAATVEPHGQLPGVSFISGSNGGYLGVPLLGVLLCGAVVLWRSRVLRVALVTSLVAYLLSLGYELHVGQRGTGVPLPAAVLGHVPLLDSVVPARFAAMTDLFCGLSLAVVLDHLRAWARPTPRRRPAPGAWPPAALLVLVSLAVGAFALVPLAALPRWPYQVVPAGLSPASEHALGALPRILRAHGARAPAVAVYPDTPSSTSSEMVVQARDGFPFVLPDGYAIVPGPGRQAVESPPVDALWLVFAAGAVHRLHLPLSAGTRHALREDLRALRVGAVVVLPAPGSAAVSRALHEALGRARQDAGASVWTIADGCARCA